MGPRVRNMPARLEEARSVQGSGTLAIGQGTLAASQGTPAFGQGTLPLSQGTLRRRAQSGVAGAGGEANTVPREACQPQRVR
eukprot:37322-Prorocentrum_minimum.AAC.1